MCAHDTSDAERLVDAAREGDTGKVAALLAEGLPPDTPDEEGTTSLYAAAVQGNADVVELLLRHGADPNRESLGDTDGTPLCAACAWDHVEVVRALLGRAAVVALLRGAAAD